MYSIFVGGGQALVTGTTAFQLDTAPSPLDARRPEVTYAASGSSVPIRESSLEGGKLGGLLQFQNEALDTVRNGLGRIAVVLAGTINEQHQLGQDALGNPGGEFFTIASPSVTASTENTGSGVVAADIVSYSDLTTKDYHLRFDGANYILTSVTNGVQGVAQTFSTFPQTVDGVRLSLTAGSVAAGDEFLIRPTVNGASQIGVAIQDASMIAAATPIRTETPLANTGFGRISAGTVNAPPPPNPNLQQPVTLTFTSANTFDVSGAGTGNPSGIAFTPGVPISYNGWTVQITGSPNAGIPSVSGLIRTAGLITAMRCCWGHCRQAARWRAVPRIIRARMVRSSAWWATKPASCK